MATLDDIARELGVSKSTVSKALNGAKDVSKLMRQTVLEKAVELGYSRVHRSTTGPKIAIFVMNMDYRKPEDFGYDIVVGFRKAAEPAGFRIEVIMLDQKLQKKMHYDEYMVLGGFSGGLFLGLSLLDPWIQDFRTCQTPTVLYDNHVPGNPNVTDIGVDNAAGMEQAVRYLQSLGHTKIGYLSSALDAFVYQQRYYAFFRAMADSGLEAGNDTVGSAFHITDCLTSHLPRLLENGCTAIICSHDMLAHSVMIHCFELGLSIPRDISIMGYDDIPLCRFTSPPLTTIRQDRVNLGKSAFYAMSCQMNGVPLSSLLLQTQLIERSSCIAADASCTSPPAAVTK